ncbi:MAG: divalent-cation tolerance protein CutA [Sphingomonadales bacterium]|nr:divalent-cation tolerance protein CutA [Sphingomonadales bacterium]
MSEIVMVYSLFPSAGEAHDACRKLLEERLIACANRLSPAISHYNWDGDIETSEEHPVIFKTTADRVERTIERIAQLHSYKTPAILAWPVDEASTPFVQWVQTQCIG